jgi:hypothetical protein
MKKDKTVEISIILALLYVAIIVIIIVTGCKDSFTNVKSRSVGFFKDISDKRWSNEMKFIKK